MKLTVFLLTIACIQVSAAGYAQKITLSENNVPLEKVFKEIKQQSGYLFWYENSLLKQAKNVDVNLNHAGLEQALDQCFKDQPLTYTIVGNTIVVRRKEIDSPPPVNIKGKVTDEKGEPLPGVSIKVKGTTIATSTNAEGLYLLPNIPDDAILIFSYIGYKSREIPVNNRSQINIGLEQDSQGLNQVVVVGYGTQKKQDVTSAVSQVQGDEIRQTPTTSLQNALTGKLPGLFTQQRSGQPGGSSAANIYIRGVSSFTGNQSPLVLVDNIEYELGQLFLIDPNEVESISILKDAASTAIYGIKGANGVILVTTRRGKVGKPVINLKTQLSLQSPVKTLEVLDAYQTALLRNEALENDGLDPEFTDEDLELFKSGADPYGHPDVNWNDVLFKHNALVTTNNLDISGGTEKVRYFTSLGYMWQDGILRDIPYKAQDQESAALSDVNNNYYAKRYNLRSNIDIKATRSLSLQLNISGSYEEANYPEATGALSHVTQFEYMNPYRYPVYNPDGSFGYADPNLAPRENLNNMAALVALGGYSRNLVDFTHLDLSGTQKLDDLTHGLSLKGEVSYSFGNTANKKLSRGQNIPSFWYNPEDGSYNPRDPLLYRIAPYTLSYSGGTPKRQLTLQGSLIYNRSFGLHNLNGLLLFNQTSETEGSEPPANFRGYTFRVGYNYNSKYLIEIDGAYNGSSRFVTQKQYQLFPAFSAGWNIAGEPFFKNAFPFMDQFKIRGSLGWVGSDDIGNDSGNKYFYEDAYKRSGSYSFGESHNNVSGIVESVQGNDDVTWETARKTDIALDFSLFRGKISGSFDWFDEYRYDILTNRSTVPIYFGVWQSNLPPVNIGKVSNKGYEIEVAYRGHAGKVGVNVKGNVAFAKNKILYMDEAPAKYPWQQATGLPIGMTKQYIWDGTFYRDQADIDASAKPAGLVQPGFLKYKDLNGDGIINVDDMAYVGNPNLPNTNIGLTLGFSYKGFSFTTLLQSALNSDASEGFDMAVPFKTNLQPIHLNRWTPGTAETATFPKLTSNFAGTYMSPNGNPSTFWTVSSDYLRVRSMTLNYTIPEKIVKKVGLGGANVFVSGYDLFTWSDILKKYQLDPEIDKETNYFVYPTQRIVNFGMNLTFK